MQAVKRINSGCILGSYHSMPFYTPCHPIVGGMLLALEMLIRDKLGKEDMSERYPQAGSGISFSNDTFLMKHHMESVEKDNPHLSYFLPDGGEVNFIWNFVFSGYVASNTILTTEETIQIILDCMNSVVEYA